MKLRMASRLTPEKLAKSGSEFAEQSALICWTTQPETRKNYPDAQKIFAVNNNAGMGDSDVGAMRGAKARQIGVKAGVGDTMLPLARHGCHGLFVEMKRRALKPKRKGSKGGLSDDQIEFRDQVQADGYGYAVAYGWEEARDIIIQYLS